VTLKSANKLSAEELFKTIHQACIQIPDTTTKIKAQIALPDFLMSGLALFSLKYPSLLQYDQERADPVSRHNLKSLFYIDDIPSDTTLRERLDELDPALLRSLYTKVFAIAQRHKVLEKYKGYPLSPTCVNI